MEYDWNQQVEIKLLDLNYRTYSHCSIIKQGLPQGSMHGPCQSKPTLLADGTSIIISYPEMEYLQNCMSDAFKASKLASTVDK
jgi:hypothetical protein